MSSSPSSPYTKQAISIDAQVLHLKQRGMSFADEGRAKDALRSIGYFRMSGYWYPFKTATGFQAGTSFDTVLATYDFDRKLRNLLLDALAIIEVALRSAISDHMCLTYGPHWYLDPSRFDATFKHAEFIQEVEKATSYGAVQGSFAASKRDDFVQHYFDTYDHPVLPPSWMVMEVISFGTISILYKYLLEKDQKSIAAAFSLDNSILASWVQCIAYLRNLCAHQSRLWNRTMTKKPKVAKLFKAYLSQNDRLYAQCVIVRLLLNSIHRGKDWHIGLSSLLQANTAIPLASMGFPPTWQQDPLWM